jgi:hypothetical protein
MPMLTITLTIESDDACEAAVTAVELVRQFPQAEVRVTDDYGQTVWTPPRKPATSERSAVAGEHGAGATRAALTNFSATYLRGGPTTQESIAC